jgi:hypothetical protein
MPINDNCFLCVHYFGDKSCFAFPNGIPDEIIVGDNLHTEPLPNQGNDIVFEKINTDFED